MNWRSPASPRTSGAAVISANRSSFLSAASGRRNSAFAVFSMARTPTTCTTTGRGEAAHELAVRSPLLEAGLGKGEIRELSRRLGLPTWQKQPFACLSSRFPYGTVITPERLARIDRCEAFLRSRDFHNFRVRFHDETARIEVAPAEIGRFFDTALREEIVREFKSAGFTYVALDLQGYRTGSMNEASP